MDHEEAHNALLAAEASDLATSAERLTELSADLGLRPLVAANPAVLADLLERLALDQDVLVRQAVAGNPNTPWKTLEQLAWEFPHVFLYNPVGPLQMIVQPEQISINKAFWESLLLVAPIPAFWWSWLRRHSTLSNIAAVRMHIQYAGEAMHPYGVLREGDEGDVLTLVELLMAASAQGISLPSFVSSDQSVVTCAQIVGEHIQRFAQSSDEKMRQAAVRNVKKPGEDGQLWSRFWSQWSQKSMHKWDIEMSLVPVETLRTLSQDEGIDMVEAVAWNWKTPVDVLQTLAQNEHENVRRGVAQNLQTPAEVLQTLASDEREGVRRYVAENSQTSDETLRMLAQDQDREVRLHVAGHAQASAETLRMLAQDQDGDVRWYVAGHAQTSAETLRMLAQDQYKVVWLYVAKHPQAPAEVLQTLAQDKDQQVRNAVAGNLQASVETLRKLAEDKLQSVRKSVALNLQTPVEVLRSLSHDQAEEVRGAVARNARTPVEVLRSLSHDQAKEVRGAVARNARTPAEVFRRLARNQAKEVRMAAAQNLQAPMEVLQILAQDHAKEVRLMANVTQRLSTEIDEAYPPDMWDTIDRILFRHTRGDYKLHPWNARGDYKDTPIEEEMEEVARHPLLESVREIMLAAFAADWGLPLIRSAFSGTAGPKNYMYLTAPFMPPIALEKLSASPSWEVRYLVALHPCTPPETRQLLSQDGNRYVRAMARATATMNM